MSVNLQRLASTPQAMLHGAVQHALGDPRTSGDMFLQNLDSILASNNEVLISVALVWLKDSLLPIALGMTKSTPQDSSSSNSNSSLKILHDAIALLVGTARMAPDAVLQNVLEALDHLFMAMPLRMIGRLEAGDPYATLLSTAPHLSQWLGRSVDSVLLQVSYKRCSDKRMHAVLAHLSPFLVQCMVADRKLSDSTAAALMRLSQIRSSARDACTSCITTAIMLRSAADVAVLSQHDTPTAVLMLPHVLSPRPDADLASSNAPDRTPLVMHHVHKLLAGKWASATHAVHAFDAVKQHSMHATSGPPLQLCATATDLLRNVVSTGGCSFETTISTTKSPTVSCATCGHCADVLTQLALAVIGAAHTPSEPPLLHLFSTAISDVLQKVVPGCDDITGRALSMHAWTLMHSLRMQLIHHITLPCPNVVKLASHDLLAQTDHLRQSMQSMHCATNTAATPPIAPYFATWEAQTAAVMHTHENCSGYKGNIATVQFLDSVVTAAVQGIRDEVHLERCQAMICALASGSLWPQPPGAISPTDAIDPPGYALPKFSVSMRTCRATQLGDPNPGFCPSAVLVAHLVALLEHPVLLCALSAAQALVATAFAAPTSVVQTFPAIVWLCNRTCSSLDRGEFKGTPEATVRLLLPMALLSGVCQAPEMDGMFFALCAQFLDLSVGSGVCMIGMRMLLTFWLMTGRGYQRVRDAMHVFQSPSSEVPLSTAATAKPPEDTSLRRTVAACTAVVARAAPEKATELVAVIHGAMADRDDGTAAMALESVSTLCREGVLDMYGAWKVVTGVLPQLPDSTLTRAWWLLLLGSGADDARSHPEQYAALVQLLWNALEHSCPVARAAAATALAHQPLDIMHELADTPPLRQCVQVMVNNCSTHSVCFEALACAAVTHEFTHRRSLLATPAPQASTGAPAQMLALRNRMLELLPAKLQRGMHAVAASAIALELTSVVTCVSERGIPVAEAETSLNTGLDDLQWSGVGVLDGVADAETAVAACMHLLKWAMDSGAADDSHLQNLLHRKLQEPSKSTARNAGVALGALCHATPLPPQSPVDTAKMLLEVVKHHRSAPAAAAGAATGAAAALAATGAPAGSFATDVASALLQRAASDAVFNSDASATCIVALGKVAASYGLQFRHVDTHAMHASNQAFSFAVHYLDEAIPGMNEILAEASMKLPEGWDTTAGDDINTVLAAVLKPQTHEASPFAAAAVNILAQLLEASEPSEATHIARILVGVLMQTTRLITSADPGSAVYGACMGAMHAAPCILQTLSSAAAPSPGEDQHSSEVGEVIEVVKVALASPLDGCHLAVALAAVGAAAVADLDRQLAAKDDDSPATLWLPDIDLASFIDSTVPDALKRGAKLKRSRIVATGAAHACAAVFCTPMGPRTTAGSKSATQVMHAAVPHSTASTSTARPLHSFPADSATLTLCKHLLERSAVTAGQGSADGKLPEASIASSAAVLARSPWIATADWAPVLEYHMHAVDASDSISEAFAAARSHLELLNMVLMHGHHASTGLGQWLGLSAESEDVWNELPMPVRLHAFACLPICLQKLTPTAQQLILRCAERAVTKTPVDTDNSVLLLKCAVARGVMMYVRMHVRHASAQDPAATRLQSQVFKLLRTLISSCMLPHAWCAGMLRFTAVPNSLPWRLVCASLEKNILEASNTSADEHACQTPESAVMLLRRACMHADFVGDNLEEYTEAAHACWCCTCPVHTVPPNPRIDELQAWTWACITAALRALPPTHLPSLEPCSDDVTACDPQHMQLMHALTVGITSIHQPRHWDSAVAMLRILATNTPEQYSIDMHANHACTSHASEWLAATSSCARAVATGANTLQQVQEVVSELLQDIAAKVGEIVEVDGENVTSAGAGRKQTQADTNTSKLFKPEFESKNGQTEKPASERSCLAYPISTALLIQVQWQILLVAYLAWHMHAHTASSLELLATADFVTLGNPAKGAEDAGRMLQVEMSEGSKGGWEMPLRLLHRTVEVVTGVTQVGVNRSDVAQGVFAVWRELQVGGICPEATSALRDSLAVLWKFLSCHDQNLLVPFLVTER